MNTFTAPLKVKLFLITACIFWAASFIATKAALTGIPPFTVVFLRLLVSSICFLLWMAATGKKIRLRSARWVGKITLLSLFGTGLHYGIQTIGLQYTTASNASLFAVTGPVSISVIAAVFLGERISFKKGLGIMIAMSGVLIVMGFDTILQFDLEGHLGGDLLVIASIVMWGAFTVMSKDMIGSSDPFELTALMTFAGTIYMLPLCGMEMVLKEYSLMSVTWESGAAVAFLGITCSFLSTVLYVKALQSYDSHRVGVYLYSIPPMTYAIAWLYLGEWIGINLLIGSAVVLTGIYLTEKG